MCGPCTCATHPSRSTSWFVVNSLWGRLDRVHLFRITGRDQLIMAKILIVDDREAFRRLNAEILKLDGHQVLMARDGRETLNLVRGEHPDVLLLDIMMAGIDGYEVCRQIKSDPATRDTIVIMVTALSESARFKSFHAGADKHVSKPISCREIRELVRSLADRRKREGSA